MLVAQVILSQYEKNRPFSKTVFTDKQKRTGFSLVVCNVDTIFNQSA